MQQYYLIVDKIPEEFENGVYSREIGTSETEIPTINLNSNARHYIQTIVPFIENTIIPIYKFTNPLMGLGLKVVMDMVHEEKPLKLQTRINTNSTNRILIIYDKGLANDYRIGNFDAVLAEEFLHLKDKNSFQKVMQSGGGSVLTIVEKDDVNNMHYSQIAGKFSPGLYCLHPKSNQILIPLKNANATIKSLILEEIVQAFDALGAKKIEIEDVTDTNMTGNGIFKAIKTSAKANLKREVIRKKEYGKGVFDYDRAIKNKYFLFDLPHIESIILSRRDGNQIKEEFLETVDLNAGLSVDALSIYGLNIGFNYQRKWHFIVEFYDKNEIRKVNFLHKIMRNFNNN